MLQLMGMKKAQLAIDMETQRLKKYIGAYAAELGRIDAIVYTAGVGEMAPHIRLGATKDLEILGIHLDEEKIELVNVVMENSISLKMVLL